MDIGGSPKFTARVYSFKQKLTLETAGRNGRGTGKWAKSRAFLPGGSIALSGEVKHAGFPLPDAWKGQEGTLTLQFHKNVNVTKTMTLSVRVVEANVSSIEGEQDGWDIGLVCLILANPTLSGFDGTQPTATDTTQADVEVYAGLSKTADPNNLLTAQTRMYDVYLGDSDAAERAKLTSLIASATANAFSGAKVKTATLLPNRADDAGVVTVQLSLTDTVEDVVNPIIQTTYDTNNLASNATSAAVNGTPGHPGGYFVEREGTAREIHDTAILSTKNYGLRDTKDDVEMPGSIRDPDPQALVSEERVTKVTDSETPPATPTPATTGLVLRARQTEQLNRVPKWRHTWVFGPRDSKEDITFPGSPRATEPSGLTDTETVTDVTATATPSTPTPNNTALKLRRTTSTRLTDAGNWQHVYDFARRNAEDDVEMDGTETTEDFGDLWPSGTVTVVHTSVNPPATPAAPAGTQSVGVVTKPLHDTKWSHEFQYKANNTLQEQTFPNSPLDDDPQNLEDQQIIASVQGSAVASWPGTPSGLKQRKFNVVQLTPTTYLARYHFSRTDTKDDAEYAKTRYDTDVSAVPVKSAAFSAAVFTVGAAPSDPANPPVDGLKLVSKTDTPLTPTLSLRVYQWGHATEGEALEFNYENVIEDANGLATAQVIATIWPATNLDPGSPEVPTNAPASPGATKTVRTVTLKLRTFKDTPITAAGKTTAGATVYGKYVRVYYYERRDTKDDAEVPHRFTETDPNGLESRQAKASLNATPSLDGGYVARATRREYVDDTNYVDVVLGGTRSTKSDIEYPGTTARYSPTQQGLSEITTVIADTGSSVLALANAYGTTRKADPTFEWAEYSRINDAYVRQTVKESSNFELIDAVSFGGKQPLMVIYGAGALVWLSKKRKRGTSGGVTLWTALCMPISAYVSYVEFTLRRRVAMTTTLPFMDRALVGRSNGNTFLGLPAFTVGFLGANPVTNLAVPQPRVVNLDLKFRFSSIGIGDDTGVIPGWSTDTYDLDSANEKQFVQASKFGWPASPAVPMDFDQFLPNP